MNEAAHQLRYYLPISCIGAPDIPLTTPTPHLVMQRKTRTGGASQSTTTDFAVVVRKTDIRSQKRMIHPLYFEGIASLQIDLNIDAPASYALRPALDFAVTNALINHDFSIGLRWGLSPVPPRPKPAALPEYEEAGFL